MEHTRGNLIAGRRPGVGTDHRRHRIGEVGADQRIGPGQLGGLRRGSRKLGADRDPRLVDEHLDRRRARHRPDVELVLERRDQPFGNGNRIVGRRLHAVGLGDDDVADPVRGEQPAGAECGTVGDQLQGVADGIVGGGLDDA